MRYTFNDVGDYVPIDGRELRRREKEAREWSYNVWMLLLVGGLLAWSLFAQKEYAIWACYAGQCFNTITTGQGAALESLAGCQSILEQTKPYSAVWEQLGVTAECRVNLPLFGWTKV